MKYRKKIPVLVDAVKWIPVGTPQGDVLAAVELVKELHVDPDHFDISEAGFFVLSTDYKQKVDSGDYVVKGMEGEIFAVPAQAFEEAFEPEILIVADMPEVIGLKPGDMIEF